MLENTIAFSITNILLCFSFFYLESTIPVLYVCQKWKPVFSNDLIAICNKYFSTKKAKADNNYNQECRDYYDELLSVLKKYESLETNIISFYSGLGAEVVSYYIISYAIIIFFWYKHTSSFLLWWQTLLVIVANIAVDVLIFFITSKIDFTKSNCFFRKYSYIEYEFSEIESQPLNPDSFSNILDYLKAEHERSFNVLSNRINAYYNCNEYYINSIHKKDARTYCLACICAFFIFSSFLW